MAAAAAEDAEVHQVGPGQKEEAAALAVLAPVPAQAQAHHAVQVQADQKVVAAAAAVQGMCHLDSSDPALEPTARLTA